jgi:hypothetical protein
VEAELLAEAQMSAKRALESAVAAAAGQIPYRIMMMNTQEEGYESIPALAGLAETAALLNVSPQRVKQLMTRHDFPIPVTMLRMGPVFIQREIEDFLDSWDRTPGRRKSATWAG